MRSLTKPSLPTPKEGYKLFTQHYALYEACIVHMLQTTRDFNIADPMLANRRGDLSPRSIVLGGWFQVSMQWYMLCMLCTASATRMWRT